MTVNKLKQEKKNNGCGETNTWCWLCIKMEVSLVCLVGECFVSTVHAEYCTVTYYTLLPAFNH